MEKEPLERKLAAILYADVAGYSRLTGEDEEGTHRTLSAYLDRTTQRQSAALRRRCGAGGVRQCGPCPDLCHEYPS